MVHEDTVHDVARREGAASGNAVHKDVIRDVTHRNARVREDALRSDVIREGADHADTTGQGTWC